jgi:hypothetical protein
VYSSTLGAVTPLVAHDDDGCPQQFAVDLGRPSCEPFCPPLYYLDPCKISLTSNHSIATSLVRGLRQPLSTDKSRIMELDKTI